MTLNPAERYAALKLLSEGISAALKDAQAEAETYRRSVRAKSLETDFGQVYVTRRKPAIRFDEAKLLTWCEDEYPNLVQRTIPTTARTWLAGNRFEIDGDDVLDATTGEVVDWATVTPASEGLTFRADADAKAAAIESVAARVELLAVALTPQLEES